VPTSFANYFRLTNTQEEAVFDFGVSDQPAPQKETSSRISNRIAMNFYTAKRLEGLLKNVTQQVEASYGPLELDIQKRLLPGAKQPSPPTQFKADSGDAPLTYANFCRAQMTPEELILDFGLTTQLTPDPAAPVRMSQRVVMSFVTAKRLSVALQAKIQQVEAAYGPLELDFQKRLLPGAKKN
jgi:hypothetical protein